MAEGTFTVDLMRKVLANPCATDKQKSDFIAGINARSTESMTREAFNALVCEQAVRIRNTGDTTRWLTDNGYIPAPVRRAKIVIEVESDGIGFADFDDWQSRLANNQVLFEQAGGKYRREPVKARAVSVVNPQRGKVLSVEIAEVR